MLGQVQRMWRYGHGVKSQNYSMVNRVYYHQVSSECVPRLYYCVFPPLYIIVFSINALPLSGQKPVFIEPVAHCLDLPRVSGFLTPAGINL